MKEVFYVTGMSCAACKAHVENAALSVKGVSFASANLLLGTLSVEGNFEYSDLLATILKEGYGLSKESPKPESKGDKDLRTLLISVAILFVLFYINMNYQMGWFYLPDIIVSNVKLVGIIEMVLSLGIMIINRRIFVSGAKGLKNLSPNMDSLVFLGSISSFLYSFVLLVIQIVINGNMKVTFWFETAGMILTFISIGKLLESRSKNKAKNALVGLYSLTPEVSNLYEDGEIFPKLTKDVEIGEVLIIKPGERVPLDGKILTGETAFDESAVTGESTPALKSVGDKVIAGTINTYGVVTMEVTDTLGNTTIDKMSKLVEEVSNSKAPISRLADIVASYFIPAVISISFCTFLVWWIFGNSISDALSRAVSVLVVSCPCALGLATPVAIVCAVTNGAKRGILFKNAEALEICGKVNTACFDKTGTITSGKMTVDEIYTIPTVTVDEVLKAACVCEKLVNHPIAEGILRGTNYEIDESKIENFKIYPGMGVGLTYEGVEYLAGTEMFIMGKERTKTPDTSVFVKRAGKVIGYLTLRDVVRPEAKETIDDLNQMGIKTVILTGDQEEITNKICKKVGAKSYFAKLLPENKVFMINKFKETGKVMMIGDGINDAPSLVASDIGIAIGEGTDVAIDSSDVVITGSSIKEVSYAVSLSKKTIRIIKENLIWAFGYNIIGIPLAAGLLGLFTDWYLTPSFCALCMSLSSVLVVSNSLRLLSLGDNKDKEGKNKMITTIVEVKGMMCQKCEKHVNDAVKYSFKVVSCVSDHEKNETIIVSEQPIDETALRQVITEADYEVGKIVVKK